MDPSNENGFVPIYEARSSLCMYGEDDDVFVVPTVLITIVWISNVTEESEREDPKIY
jgi:hypothetical protein